MTDKPDTNAKNTKMNASFNFFGHWVLRFFLIKVPLQYFITYGVISGLFSDGAIGLELSNILSSYIAGVLALVMLEDSTYENKKEGTVYQLTFENFNGYPNTITWIRVYFGIFWRVYLISFILSLILPNGNFSVIYFSVVVDLLSLMIGWMWYFASHSKKSIHLDLTIERYKSPVIIEGMTLNKIRNTIVLSAAIIIGLIVAYFTFSFLGSVETRVRLPRILIFVILIIGWETTFVLMAEGLGLLMGYTVYRFLSK